MFPQKQAEENKLMTEKKPEETPDNSTINSDTNTTIGSPLQASSPSPPSVVRPHSEGSGDRHSIRSVRTLLSPIRGSNLDTDPMPVTLDSFFGNFEKSIPVAASPSSMPHQLEQELLRSEVSAMEEDEAKTLLAKILIDNEGLRQELRSKEKRIIAYKGQMLAILDWKARQECDGDGGDDGHALNVIPNENAQLSCGVTRSHSGAYIHHQAFPGTDERIETIMLPQKTVHSAQEVTYVEEGFGVRRSLSIMQELAMSIDVDQELLRQRLKHSYHMTNQLVLGGAVGWLAANFVKKFGKLALSATGGGLALLVYTARKGFVHVNYESIYEEISKLCGDNVDADNANNDTVDNNNDVANLNDISNCDNASFDNGQANVLGASMNGGCNINKSTNELHQLGTFDKLRQAKNWIAAHTYTVGGFALSFAYNII